MKKIILALAALLSVSSANVTSQSFINPDDHLLNGFSAKISGLDFEYHSCIPGLRESILIRANGGKEFMEWETSPVPEKIDGEICSLCLGGCPWLQSRQSEDGS
ncbi:MAG: hypothetical protein MZV63_61305 [Marinilabiliales bacterium]|nr:hypothetical protein [Marinilabiliales bacterium]